MARSTIREPNFETACSWWTDIPNQWTPIGWKNHLFRYSILWNGSVLAQPDRNRRTERYAGMGLQVAFLPSYTGRSPKRLPGFFYQDDGMITQGWEDSDAPLIWSEYSQDGVMLRNHAFAHILGGGDVQTGIEPLFAWVRLSIHDLCPGLPLEDKHGFILLLHSPHLDHRMELRSNLLFRTERSRYPRALKPQSESYRAKSHWRLLEPDGTVRLGIPAGQKCTVAFKEPADDKTAYEVYIQMDAKKGRHVDVLIPMLPTPKAAFDKEIALGYDGALAQANRYWKPVPKTAARIQVPETFINETFKHSMKFAEILNEKNPDTGKYCIINGSLAYVNLWSTPGSMSTVWLMDMLGYHDVVARYLEIFREEQGTVTPPGPAYKPHPGYLSTPALYKSVDWLSDNGAVLYMLAMHGLLSGDKEYMARYTETIVKSCDWIRDSRAIRKHGGVEGVLPAAVATDKGTTFQSIWNIGWNYKGLTTAVKLLRQIGHPRAEEFAREAEDYRKVFLKAYHAKCKTTPTWRDARGRRHPILPIALAGDDKSETRHAFYLDTGPMFLVWAGLFDADDDLMKSTVLWFREGPQHKFYRDDSNCWQVPVLRHEMSSCEPCYSWNIFHSHQLGDRMRYLEFMYSIFAGSLSRKTYISCETRGGITGNIFTALMGSLLVRLAMIDDEWRDRELHLLRFMPLAWLGNGEEAIFERIPTMYGPVTLKTKMSRDGKRLDVTFAPQFRTKPAKIVLHMPPFDRRVALKINGRPAKLKGKTVDVE